ncbi:MAG TPA: AarF/ABC1/UbiB kinase family protein [Gaiellaceae bacterium]|nr:AarF/ABC1/UbiB kinase family protein [Gaiellaceae bacterium]
MARPAPSSRPAVRQLGRLSEIAQVAARHGFGYLFDARRLDGLPFRQREVEVVAEEGSSRGQRLRTMLDELGPTFVKFGQLLSTRPDVVPPDIVFELRHLQDAVTPFSYEEAERVIREDLGLSVEQLFLEFDRDPVAAASIGQVHRAVLPNGKRVVVKVQRPDAPRQIEADLELMYQAARFARDRVKALSFIDTTSLVDEFARTIRQELDYRMEARNAEQFHRNFAGHPHVRIPRVYWPYSRARVLTLERLDGVHLRDIDLASYTLDERARLATLITDAWMAMIFRHGFFHADPHPSNILVLEQAEQVGLIDFGMAGKLSDDDMSKATRLFIDIVNEQVDRIPRDLAALGVRFDKSREEEFAGEIRDFYYRYYGARLNEIDPIQVIREVFAVIFRLHLQLPTRFVMLDRAIATLGSVGLELYPDFNVFEVAKPYARELMLERFTPRRLALRARQQGTDYARMALELPYQVHDTLQQVRDGQVEVGFRHEGLDELFHRLDLVFNRLTVAIVAVGGAIASSLIGIFAEEGPTIWGLHFLSVIGFSLSALLGIWLVWGVIRSGRL